MIDPFVLLTPILLLGVLALLRFVGCDWVIGLNEFTHDADVTSITPDTLVPCGTFTVHGDGFVDGSTVTWNASPALTTTFISPNELQVHVDLALGDTLPSSVFVTVMSPSNGASEAFTYKPTVGNSPINVWPLLNQPGAPAPGPLTGDVQGLTFDTEFSLEDFSPTGGDTDAVFGPGGSSGVFSFTNGPRLLQQIVVHNVSGANGTITLQDDRGQPTVTMTVPPGQLMNVAVPTSWTMCSAHITVMFSAPDGIRIHQIAWLGPR